MKKLDEFVKTKTNENINEAMTKAQFDKQQEKESKEVEKLVGKSAETNGTHGKFAIDEPVDDEVAEPFDKATMTKNEKRLLMKFKAKEPFFIMGKAGWGKTSIITDMAKKRFKRTVITVYLDKAQATDLEGIPVPVKDEDGSIYQDTAMPKWAKYMKDRPDTQFLLFFDEMNQAADDVMNALMPIVLKNVVSGYQFENFIVGAAGNFKHENDAVNELSKPLASRFKPLIIWDSNNDAEWKSAFKFMHKKWDDKVGESFINKIEENAYLFDNPRDVELKIIKWASELKGDEDIDLFDVEDILERIEDLLIEDISREDERKVKEIAEFVHKYLNTKEEETKETSSRSRRSKDKEMISEKMKRNIRKAMTNGSIYEPDDNTHYGVSRENIAKIFCNPDTCEEPISKEMLDRLILKFEADEYKFKFETDAQYKKAGFADPFED